MEIGISHGIVVADGTLITTMFRFRATIRAVGAKTMMTGTSIGVMTTKTVSGPGRGIVSSRTAHGTFTSTIFSNKTSLSTTHGKTYLSRKISIVELQTPTKGCQRTMRKCLGILLKRHLRISWRKSRTKLTETQFFVLHPKIKYLIH